MIIDLLKRVGIVLIMGLCIGLLFLGGLHTNAKMKIQEQTKDWIKPIEGILSDKFGTRNGKHKGIDIAAKEGEKVKSVDNGKVKKSYFSHSYGHVIFIEHPSGIETVYAHLRERHVQEGENVKKGQVIGIVGSTGMSTGIHLHFEAHQGNWTVDKQNAFDPLLAFSIKDFTDEKEIEVSNKVEVVTVKKGDTLWSISQKYHVSVELIKKWNQLHSDLIYPNQELVLHS
ncbi:peptidoglycan DD-metalloendopeptidase family protein [Bacillus alveayuensis]|uniref:peptidoglycan DD-metalloendopeptidase family protein n=1 Tax=Aeribacillus alveayuensis TaxID=279215 RepID=UPI000696CE42|nr:peptidoglycan DD-metalloendopeptidase family protein [Bacillus alveayuensis]